MNFRSINIAKLSSMDSQVLAPKNLRRSSKTNIIVDRRQRKRSGLTVKNEMCMLFLFNITCISGTKISYGTIR